MNVNGKHYRTIWEVEGGVEIIDQTLLPHEFKTTILRSLNDCAHAIKAMLVRGAPLIGATAAYGMVLQCRENSDDAAVQSAYDALLSTRPTAINLRWALDRMRAAILPVTKAERYALARKTAATICDEDVALNESIGRHGLAIFQGIQQKQG